MDATHCVRYTSLECRDVACSVLKVNINIVGTRHGVSVVNIHLVGTQRIASAPIINHSSPTSDRLYKYFQYAFQN